MVNITLFTGNDCPLCDTAKSMLQTPGLPGYEMAQINVKQERSYYHQYGARIPVLKREDTGAELGWPFDIDALQLFLS